MEKQKIALDIGSGDVKVFHLDSNGAERFFKFPSAVSVQNEAQTAFGSDNSIKYNGENYKVGEDAIFEAIPSRSVDFQKNYNGLLAYKAITMAGLDLEKPIEIVTGLTLRYWKQRKDIVKSMKKLIVNDTQFDTSVPKIFAQGQGTFIDEGSPDGSIIIIDGGYNTLDFLAFRDGKPILESCYANNEGANKIISNVKSHIERKYDVTISEQQARKFFDKRHVNILGREYDLSDMIRRVQKSYLDGLFMSLKAKDEKLLNFADKVIFSGGLAYFLEDVKLGGNTSLAKEPYEYSNVRGYYYG